MAFDEFWWSGCEDNGIDSGTMVAEIEVCVRRGWFTWKWSGFEKELGLGCHYWELLQIRSGKFYFAFRVLR